MPNTNYGERPVSAQELVELFGSARAALNATGGENRLALYYINNPDRCADAPKVGALENDVTRELRGMRDLQDATEANAKRQASWLARVAQAREAYALKPSLRQVMHSCSCGRRMAKRLIAAF